jgi:carboxyl-terminal processing protease
MVAGPRGGLKFWRFFADYPRTPAGATDGLASPQPGRFDRERADTVKWKEHVPTSNRSVPGGRQGHLPMSSRTRLIVLIVSAPVIAFAVIGGFLGRAIARDDTYQHLRVFEDVVSLIVNNYVEDVNVDKVMSGAMTGMAEALDADSAYLTPAQVQSFERGDQPGPAFTGLTLTRQYYLRVVAARDQSPAARAGLRPGDYIRAIDGKPTRDMSVFEGDRLLAGPAGSKVVLTVIRGNAADPHDIDVTREAPQGPEVSGKMMPSDVGYLRIAEFGKTAASAIQSQVADLRKSGAASLVIDLRGTAGGEFDQAISAAKLFVPSGTLGYREAKGIEKATITAGSGDGSIDLPAAVLVDEGSSGPAEVFAAALDGNKRAELIGERTLGRAAVQKLVKLPDGSGLWLSGARYLTPSGDPLNEKGIQPDVEVEQPDVELGGEPPATDATLDKALERLSMKKAA